MLYKDNWIQYSLSNADYTKENNLFPKLSLSFNKVNSSTISSFFEELVNNAKYVYENNKNCILFFSGGTNSQIILQVYNKLKIPLKVIILRFNNNYNSKEFFMASKFCEDLNISYKVLNIDIDKFFENKALDILAKCKTIDPYKLILLHACSLVDETPIVGNKFPYIYRSSFDYSEQAQWCIKFCAEDFIFESYKEKEIIGDWFHYSHEIIFSLLDTITVKRQMANNYLGKRSILTSRNKLLEDDIVLYDRIKSIGFDDIIIPPSMINFFNIYIKDKLGKTNNCFEYPIHYFKSQIFPSDEQLY